MTLVYLVRHGQSLWNACGRLQGQADVPLSPQGEAEALDLGLRLAGTTFARVVASDLERARATATLLGLGEPLLDPDLREIDVGQWEGRSVRDLRAHDRAAYTRWRAGGHTPPGGEPWVDFRERVEAALGRHVAGAGGGRLLVVTHGGAIRAALETSLGVSAGAIGPALPGSLSILSIAKRARLIAYNLGPIEQTLGTETTLYSRFRSA